MSLCNSPTLGKNHGVLRTANSMSLRHTDCKMSFSGGQVSWNANPDTDFTVASGSQHSNSSELRTLKFCLFRIELTWELFSWLLFRLVFAVIQVKFAYCLPGLLTMLLEFSWLHTKSLDFRSEGFTRHRSYVASPCYTSGITNPKEEVLDTSSCWSKKRCVYSSSLQFNLI